MPSKNGSQLTDRFRQRAMGFVIASGRLLIPTVAIAFTVVSANAQTAASFYQGKQINFVVSSSAGGGFDSFARLIARHIQKHMEGRPSFLVQNMPGAGGVRAANFLYAAAPRDGTTIGLFQNTVPLEPLYGNKLALFDVNKMQWLGSPSQEFAVFAIWHSVPINTIEDARTHELVIGAPGSNSSPAFYGRLFRSIFGIRMKILAGYPGESEALLAMEQRENDGNTSAYWSSLKATHPDWITQRKLKFLLQYGAHPLPELKGVPFALDLIKDPVKRDMMEVASAPLLLGRPIAAPPKVPPERIAALRKALTDTFRDPAYLADCAQVGLECGDPATAIDITKGLMRAYNASPEVVRNLRQIYQAGSSE
jgi:tripartite-type tricarboxylate transporter receptor subunit TctC